MYSGIATKITSTKNYIKTTIYVLPEISGVISTKLLSSSLRTRTNSGPIFCGSTTSVSPYKTNEILELARNPNSLDTVTFLNSNYMFRLPLSNTTADTLTLAAALGLGAGAAATPTGEMFATSAFCNINVYEVSTPLRVFGLIV